ncbi:hypothetical protein ULG90_02870 [Halopseudomonas pachastrellae]|nr:hypothetical protein ULG90_02870 [Halopseudomonas pachastrellae]
MPGYLGHAAGRAAVSADLAMRVVFVSPGKLDEPFWRDADEGRGTRPPRWALSWSYCMPSVIIWPS